MDSTIEVVFTLANETERKFNNFTNTTEASFELVRLNPSLNENFFCVQVGALQFRISVCQHLKLIKIMNFIVFQYHYFLAESDRASNAKDKPKLNQE